jgi:hypothetical protein
LISDPPLTLTTEEVHRRRAKNGPNSIVDVRQHPALCTVQKPWAPVLSSNGILMAAPPVAIVTGLFAAAALAFVLDGVKLTLFRRLEVS